MQGLLTIGLAGLAGDAADHRQILFRHPDRRDHAARHLRRADAHYTFEVDHDFRRWLTGIGRFTYGTLDYQGDNRTDKIYTLSGDLIYKLTRSLWLKGTVQRSWLDSNSPGSSSGVDGGDGRGALQN